MEIVCPQCQKKYTVPDDSAGKKVQCKNTSCGHVFHIPQPAPAIDDFLTLEPLPPPPATMAQPSAVSVPKKQNPRLDWKMSAMIAGGILAMLIVGGLIFAAVSRLMEGGGVPEWAVYMIPEDSEGIAYVNVDDIHKNDLFSEVQNALEKMAKSQKFGADFDPDDISEVFVAGSKEPLVVVRLKKDYALKDFLPKLHKDQNSKTFDKVEYVELTLGGVLAKTGDRTFCFVPDEESLKSAIGRMNRKERAKINENLQKSLDAVVGNSLYFAGLNTAGPGLPFKIERFHIRSSVKSSSIWIEATLVVVNVKDAEEFKKLADETLGNATKQIPPQMNEMKKLIEPLIAGISIRQSDKNIYVEVNWKNADIRALIDSFKKQFGGGGMPFGRFPF